MPEFYDKLVKAYNDPALMPIKYSRDSHKPLLPSPAPHLIQYASKEAEIVAQPGRKHALTLSTNMAGWGTNIILGGNRKTVPCLCLEVKQVAAPLMYSQVSLGREVKQEDMG
ncbi:hypothetical protein JHK82_025072 [Glycine max]|nr:hypothetical protein JHK82_025072 [Glycine max]